MIAVHMLLFTFWAGFIQHWTLQEGLKCCPFSEFDLEETQTAHTEPASTHKTPFGMNCKADGEPGLITQHQWQA